MDQNRASAPPRSFMRQRSARVKLLGSVLALLQLDTGNSLRATVHQLSSNGGVLQMTEPLDQRVRVEIALHLGSTTVRGPIEMLGPMWATHGCLQPFRFTGLRNGEQAQLRHDLELLLKKARGRRTIGPQWNLSANGQ